MMHVAWFRQLTLRSKVLLTACAAVVVLISVYSFTRQTPPPSIPFSHYVSPIGFEIDYPEGWEILEVKGVDNSFGGAYFFPAGSIQSPSKWMKNADITQQLITVSGIANLRMYDETKKWLAGADTQELVQPGIRGRITRTSRMTIDGEEAFVFSYVDSENGFKGKQAIVLAKPVRDPGESLAIFLVIDYKAKEPFYSEEIAMSTIASFTERVLQMMEERDRAELERQDEAIRQAINAVGGINPTYLPAGVLQRPTRLPQKDVDGSYGALIHLYACEADQYGRTFITIERHLFTSVGNDILERKVQSLRNQDMMTLSDTEVNGRKAVLATYDNRPKQLLWQDDTSFLIIEVSMRATCSITEEELLNIARSM